MADLRNFLPFTRYPFTGVSAACSLCGADEGTVVSLWDRRLKRLRTICCDICGLLRTDPMPSEPELDRYYGGQYRQDYQLAGRTPPARHIRKSLRDAERRRDPVAHPLRPGDRVLDFGSGSGEFLHLMQQAGFSVLGLEPGRDYAAYARRAYG